MHRPRRRSRVTAMGAALTVAAAALAGVAAAPAGAAAPEGAGRYLVTFADEPAATYRGGIAAFARTAPLNGQKLNPTRAEVVRYRDRLAKVHDSALRAVGATKLYDYSVATNGVAAELTAAQVRRLSKAAGVVRLEKDVMRVLDTVDTPGYLGLPGTDGLWSAVNAGDIAGGSAGKDVIVGVIDSGIWPESASFAGTTLRRNKAGQPIVATGLRGQWFGDCVQGEHFDSHDCNDKLIGARFYLKGFGARNLPQAEYVSPRDGGGHGTHTASTAAGKRVTGVSIEGKELGTASGMAPAARVAAYKVCWEAKQGDGGCFNSDSVAAIEDAVADGVDVINYSVGAGSESSPLDAVEQAYRRAASIGIFVAASAGNSGPDASTLDHPSPWLTTVAASTFKVSERAVVLGNNDTFVGASITGPLETLRSLVRSVAVKTGAAKETDAALCAPGTLDPARTVGKVVQCDRGVVSRIDKSFEVQRAGGVGMVLTNVSANSLNGDYHPIPTVHVDEVAREKILEYIRTTTDPTAAIRSGTSGTEAPAVASFSSRGPSTTTGGDILKPDLSAPGVDVLASVAPPSNHGRSFDYYSGTSMSSPHVAGLAAVLRGKHRDWSPMAIKSALMTTAKDHVTGADPFAQGAGFVRPLAALTPGLVFDAARASDALAADIGDAMAWRRYTVGLGVTFASLPTLTGISGTAVNQASISIGGMAGTATVPRTVRNVGSAAAYEMSTDLAGLAVSATGLSTPIGVDELRGLAFTFTRTTAPLGAWVKGSITLTGGGSTVRIPVTIRPVAVAAPENVTGTIAAGSTTYQVTPGYTGVLPTVARGLVAAQPTAGAVTTGEFVPGTVDAATKKYERVVAGERVVRFDVDAASVNDDLDLYVYRKVADEEELVAFSASGAADEQVTLRDPEPGVYVAYVNGFATGGGGAYAYRQWAVPGSDSTNFAAVPSQSSVTLATPVTVTATWTGLTAGTRYLGYVDYSSAAAPTAPVTVVSVQ